MVAVFVADHLGGLSVQLLFLAAGIILAAEAGLLIGVMLPGASTAIALGFLVRPVGGNWPFVLACLAAVAATTIGSHYGYIRGGRHVFSQPSDRWLAGQINKRVPVQRREQALSRLQRSSTALVAASQCIGVLRTLTPRLASRAGGSR